MVGNDFFRSKMNKNKVPDLSSPKIYHFIYKNPYFHLYFGYNEVPEAKMTIFGPFIEVNVHFWWGEWSRTLFLSILELKKSFPTIPPSKINILLYILVIEEQNAHIGII